MQPPSKSFLDVPGNSKSEQPGSSSDAVKSQLRGWTQSVASEQQQVHEEVGREQDYVFLSKDKKEGDSPTASQSRFAVLRPSRSV